MSWIGLIADLGPVPAHFVHLLLFVSKWTETVDRITTDTLRHDKYNLTFEDFHARLMNTMFGNSGI